MGGSVIEIICNELYGECKPFMVIEDSIVDQKYRRLAITSELMPTLEEHATTPNCTYIIFVTQSKRSDAIGFYQSLGYKADKYKG